MGKLLSSLVARQLLEDPPYFLLSEKVAQVVVGCGRRDWLRS